MSEKINYSDFENAITDVEEATQDFSDEELSLFIEDLKTAEGLEEIEVDANLIREIIFDVDNNEDPYKIAEEIRSLAKELEVPVTYNLLLKILQVAKGEIVALDIPVDVSERQSAEGIAFDAAEITPLRDEALKPFVSEIAPKKQEVIVNSENAPKDKPIFAVCSNGNGRSKFVARVLGGLGYDQARAIGFHNLHKLDSDLERELLASKVIVCTNTDVAATLSAYDGGRLVKDKIIIDLTMHENDHAIAIGHMTEEMQIALEKKLTAQLQGFGF